MLSWPARNSGQPPAITRIVCLPSTYSYPAACSCSTSAHCSSTPPHSGRRCRTCSRRGAKGTTSLLFCSSSSPRLVRIFSLLIKTTSAAIRRLRNLCAGTRDRASVLIAQSATVPHTRADIPSSDLFSPLQLQRSPQLPSTSVKKRYQKSSVCL